MKLIAYIHAGVIDEYDIWIEEIVPDTDTLGNVVAVKLSGQVVVPYCCVTSYKLLPVNLSSKP